MIFHNKNSNIGEYICIMRHINNMPKTKTTHKNVITSILLFMSIVWLPNSLLAQSVGQLQQQINQKNAEINRTENRIQTLRQRGDTLQNRLNILNAEADKLRSQIEVTENAISRTRAEIREKEAELERLKSQIQENVRVLYKHGEPSTLEILFSSDNFSDFINKKEYLDSAKDAMEAAASESTRIKEELERKAKDLKNKASELEGQRKQLASKQEEQRQLVAQTRGEERRYQSIVSQQRDEKQRLEAQQRAAYAAAAARAQANGQFISIGGSGSYPWANQPAPCHSSSCVDPWGLYYNECVSYVAWKLDSQGKMVQGFGGAGNANQWPSTTSHYTNQVGPKVGTAAVDASIYPYGHVMYVEAVLDGGSRVRISEYNFNGPGVYSERIISSQGLTFLEFPSR